MLNEQCRERFEYQIEQVRNFYDAYDQVKIAKFTVVWMTDLAHDYVNGLYHADEYFNRFFADNTQMLRDSFVFVMGDHGKHFGPFSTTEVYGNFK
jgi:membrane-anchored protein YejM (alkaline phosphatase superfamily)